MKPNFLLFIAFFNALLLSSCGSVSSKNFSIQFIEAPKIIQEGSSVSWKLHNPSDYVIENLTFKLNNEITADNSITFNENQLGHHELKASFEVNGKPIEISKNMTVFASKKPVLYGYKIINTYPHDINAYTQGLEFYKDAFYESTGQYGASSLRKVDFKTGKVIQKLPLNNSYFGEGITVVNDQIIQLTWKSKMGFVYDPTTFELVKSFSYNQSLEGWGLCNDGSQLYKSDGSEHIWILDADNQSELGKITAVTNNKVIKNINELEWVDGKIYANTYQFNKEVGIIINPDTGAVEGVIDFSGLKQKVKKHPKLDVLNGIAFHPKRKTFFVTGKNWNKLFEVAIFKK
jgi:glutamine cyclotransferase